MAAPDEPLGKRKSKAPKAFQPTYGSFSKSGAGSELESPIGEGDSLQSIPIIKDRLGALNQDAAELKFLHSVIFGNEGESKSRKKMLLEFKGLSGGSSASTDAMRVRANKVLQEPATKGMVPTLAHILALSVLGSSGKAVSQIVQFLSVPSEKLCTELAVDPGASSGEDRDDAEPNGTAPAKEPRTKPAAPRKTAKKAREAAAQMEEEPSQKRQRGARASKPKAAAKKPAAKPAAKKPAAKKPAKRKASEVEAEAEPEAEVAADADVPEEEHEAPEDDGEQPDEEMQEPAEDPVDQEAEEAQEEPQDDEEEALGLDMHPGDAPPEKGGPCLQHEVPVEAVQRDQEPLLEGDDSEEPEPPPPGLENDLEHAQHVGVPGHLHAMAHTLVAARAARPKPAAVSAPPQRPAIGSQASPCDAAQPGSHGGSMPPQLGPHALQPPLQEGVATSSRAAPSHDIGNSISKARGANKRVRHPTTKASLGVQGGTVYKKSVPNSRRGATAVAAVAAVVGQPAKPDVKKSREKAQPPGDITKLLQQAEKHQKALVAVHNHVKSLVEDHSALLNNLRKVAGDSS